MPDLRAGALVRRRLRDNGLGLVFGGLFLLALVGQAFAGNGQYNEEQAADGLDRISLWEYVRTSDFAVDVAENWQSEYLQFTLFILATVWLVQRGSPESKQLDERGRGTDADQRLGQHIRAASSSWAKAGGWRTSLYSHSLVLVMGSIFLLSWLAQSIAGWATYNEEQLRQRTSTTTWVEYLAMPDFWSRTLQNWQSEFLAVGSMVVLSIYLRERGSPESKPVGDPHDETADTG
ncbi:MAG: hypothetical protein JWN88_2313 [Frankiales bacterium]|nr:hypothetical protein [Frankiales bacterium]